MFDTDNDGLEDGEEVIAGADNFVTHANNSDTDGDGLLDGNEILFIPRPFQHETNPLINDTDADGMLDGWEMQVKSTEENTNSHSYGLLSQIGIDPDALKVHPTAALWNLAAMFGSIGSAALNCKRSTRCTK